MTTITDLYNATYEIADEKLRVDVVDVIVWAQEDANQSFSDGTEYSVTEEDSRTLTYLEVILCCGENGKVNDTPYADIAAWFRTNGFNF
jgi:hypothetical protein